MTTGYEGMVPGKWYQASDGNWYCWPNPTAYSGPPAVPMPPMPPALPAAVPVQRDFTYAKRRGGWGRVLAVGLALLVLAGGGTAYAIHWQDSRSEKEAARRVAAAQAVAEAQRAADARAAADKKAEDAARHKRIETYLVVVEPTVAQLLQPLTEMFEQNREASAVGTRLRLTELEGVLGRAKAPADVAAEAAGLRDAVRQLNTRFKRMVFVNDHGSVDAYNLALADVVMAVGPFFASLRRLYGKAGRPPAPAIRRFLPL